MVDNVLLIGGKAMLCSIFAFAALAKLRDRTGTRQSLAGFAIPGRLVSPLVFLLPAVELGTALLLVVPAFTGIGAAIAIGLLCCFNLVIAINIRNGNRPTCSCFGRWHRSPISWSHVGRNLGLIGIAALVLGIASGTRVPIEAVTGGDAFVTGQVLVDALILCVLGIGFSRLRGLMAPGANPETLESPPTGNLRSIAPDFTLHDLSGRQFTIQGLLRRARPTVLIFVNAQCGQCTALLPDIARWQRTLGDVITVVPVIAGTSRDANRELFDQYQLPLVLEQEYREVSDAYGIRLTPTAVVLDPAGAISGLPVVGPEPIRQLIQGLIAASSGSAPSTREHRAAGPHLISSEARAS